MSSVVKCNNCNVVINEVLAFICNKIDVMDEESISRICISAFSESEVKIAKDLLYDSISTTRRKITRKRDGKTLREIDDIICLLKETDPEEIPIFVARDLQKLPPVLFDHVDVTRLLKDLLKMQCEIKQIKEHYVTEEQLQPLKSEIEELNNRITTCTINSEDITSVNSHQELVNSSITIPNHNKNELGKQQQNMNERGAPRLSYQKSAKAPVKTPEVDPNITEREPSARVAAVLELQGQKDTRHEANPTISEREPIAHVSRVAPASRGHTATSSVQMRQKSFAEVTQEGIWKNESQSHEWIQVQRKRYRNRFIANRGNAIVTSDSNFKAADIKIPIYIYNVAKAVPVCSIVEYVKNKTNIEVMIEKMNMTIEKEYDSYKIFIPRNKLD
ncbi:hypothetical protein B5X24_HaOG203350, partial [Helicoverpa armigera]